MQKSGVAKGYLACSQAHFRVASGNEGSSADYCADTSRSLEYHDHDEVCPRRSLNAANRDRHAEPKETCKCRFWATSGQPVDSAATARGNAKKCGCKKPIISALEIQEASEQ